MKVCALSVQYFVIYFTCLLDEELKLQCGFIICQCVFPDVPVLLVFLSGREGPT